MNWENDSYRTIRIELAGNDMVRDRNDEIIEGFDVVDMHLSKRYRPGSYIHANM